jgi:hypothetical protein
MEERAAPVAHKSRGRDLLARRLDVSFALLLPAYGSYNVIHRLIVHLADGVFYEQHPALNAARLGLVHRSVARHLTAFQAAGIMDVN